jgi:hypothetical protein
MKQRLLVSGFAIAGLLCLGLGFAWNRFTSSENYWTPTQAEEFNTAQSDLHKKSRFVQNESAAQRQEFNAAKERFDRISNQLDRARSSRANTETGLKIVGAVAVLVAAYLQWKSGGSD